MCFLRARKGHLIKLPRILIRPIKLFFLILLALMQPAMATSLFLIQGSGGGGGGGGETAKMADSLVDSIGVNTHMGTRNSNYVSLYSKWATALTNIGIRHVRESFSQNAEQTYGIPLVSQFYAANGVNIKYLLFQEPSPYTCNGSASNFTNPSIYLTWGCRLTISLRSRE